MHCALVIDGFSDLHEGKDCVVEGVGDDGMCELMFFLRRPYRASQLCRIRGGQQHFGIWIL